MGRPKWQSRSSQPGDVVPLPARRLELLLQEVGRLTLARDQPLDPLAHPVLDPCDLPSVLIDVCLMAAVPLALPPQPGVLVAKVGDRPADAALQTQSIPRLGAGDLLAAVPAEDQDPAHATTLTSATTAPLSSRNSSGTI